MYTSAVKFSAVLTIQRKNLNLIKLDFMRECYFEKYKISLRGLYNHVGARILISNENKKFFSVISKPVSNFPVTIGFYCPSEDFGIKIFNFKSGTTVEKFTHPVSEKILIFSSINMDISVREVVCDASCSQFFEEFNMLNLNYRNNGEF